MGLTPRHGVDEIMELMERAFPPPSKDPVDAVRQCRVTVAEDFKHKVSHMEKYAQLRGDIPLHYGFTMRALKMLERIGANWFVDGKFVSRFKYSASVGAKFEDYPVIGHFWSRGFRHDAAMLYEGDLPEFVLDRALLAKKVGLDYLTVHSHNPFPVSYIELPQEDPVLVAWGLNPGIEVQEQAKCRANGDCLGVVLAVWEGENEIDLNGDII